MEKISFDDFKKIEVKIGEVIACEKLEGTDKLLKLTVDFGEEVPRTIVSGVALHVTSPQDLVGKKFPFVTNLAPRVICGVESNGMIMATTDDQSQFSFLEPTSPIAKGAKVV